MSRHRLCGQSILNPVLVAGNGLHTANAYVELRNPAEFLGIPVATRYKGKSAFPELHPLATGMMGNFGQALANTVIAEADVLIVAGSRLSPNNVLYERTRLIDPSRQRISASFWLFISPPPRTVSLRCTSQLSRASVKPKAALRSRPAPPGCSRCAQRAP